MPVSDKALLAEIRKYNPRLAELFDKEGPLRTFKLIQEFHGNDALQKSAKSINDQLMNAINTSYQALLTLLTSDNNRFVNKIYKPEFENLALLLFIGMKFHKLGNPSSAFKEIRKTFNALKNILKTMGLNPSDEATLINDTMMKVISNKNADNIKPDDIYRAFEEEAAKNAAPSTKPRPLETLQEEEDHSQSLSLNEVYIDQDDADLGETSIDPLAQKIIHYQEIISSARIKEATIKKQLEALVEAHRSVDQSSAISSLRTEIKTLYDNEVYGLDVKIFDECHSDNLTEDKKYAHIFDQALRLQKRVEDLLDTWPTVTPATASTAGIITIAIENNEEDDDEEEEKENKYDDDDENHAANNMSPKDLILLATHLKKLNTLAHYSNLAASKQMKIKNTYLDVAKAVVIQKLNDRALTGFAKTEAELISEQQQLDKIKPCDEIMQFGKSCTFVSNDRTQINNAIAAINNNTFAPPSSTADQTQPIDPKKQEARVTELALNDTTLPNSAKGTIVERYRTEGDQRFISESHIPKDLSTDQLKAWARATVESFWAAAPPDTKKLSLEDGFTHEQLAALVSYCNYKGYAFEIGEMQKIRFFADELKSKGYIDQSMAASLRSNKAVSLPNSADLIQKIDGLGFNYTTPDGWAKNIIDKFDARLGCSDEHWRDWCIANEDPRIPPLGSKRFGELMKEFDKLEAALPRSDSENEVATPRARVERRSNRYRVFQPKDNASDNSDEELDEEPSPPFASLGMGKKHPQQ